jgi:hypothetical protein
VYYTLASSKFMEIFVSLKVALVAVCKGYLCIATDESIDDLKMCRQEILVLFAKCNSSLLWVT